MLYAGFSPPGTLASLAHFQKGKDLNISGETVAKLNRFVRFTLQSSSPKSSCTTLNTFYRNS